MSEREQRRTEIEQTFDYDGYQVARRELFAHLRDPAIIIRKDSITFNTACIAGLEDVVYVNIMFNSDLKRLVVSADCTAFSGVNIRHNADAAAF